MYCFEYYSKDCSPIRIITSRKNQLIKHTQIMKVTIVIMVLQPAVVWLSRKMY